MGSFGETIKRERELREISLRQVAEATKINLRYLEALEQNQFDVLPGGLFNKGFIRAYATFIGVDAEAMVNSYLHEMAARDDQNATHLQTHGEPGMHRPADLPSRRSTRRGDAATGPRRAPTILFGPPAADGGAPRRVAPSPPAAPGTAVATPGSAAPGPHPAPDHAGPYPTNRPPAIHAIVESTPLPKQRPRALLGILLLVLGTALIFLVLGLISGRGPGVGRREEPVAGPVSWPANDGAGSAPAIVDTGIVLLENTAGPAATPTPTQIAAAAVPPPVSIPAPSPESPAGIPTRTLRPTAEPGREVAPAGEDKPPVATPSERETIPSIPGAMLLEVTAATPTFVNVVCDQENAIYSLLAAGETRALTCRSVIKISAHDAGAVHLRVNGADCLPLGEPGARAFGYTIRIDDHERICRPAGGRFDGRS